MRITLLICAVLFLAARASIVQVPTKPEIVRLDGSKISFADADSFARKTLDDAQVMGAQLAFVEKGKLVWSAAYGWRGRDPNLPMDRDTTTWAASITKGLFATYVMQLVERGEFHLDQPVAQQLPKPLDQYDPYKEKASELVKDPAWPSVTPRMLLSHSAGLANFAFIEPDKKMHLHFKPGTQFLYSGEGINLVQFLIEEQQKKPLDLLMQESIFGPLGMSRTGLIFRPEFEADVADRFDQNGKFIAKTRRAPARGAGSMTTSAEDLSRFASALLEGRILKDSTREEMLSPVIQIRSLHQFPLAPNESAGKEAASVGLAYGIAWGLLTHTKYGPAFFKEGHGDGAQNYMICFEKQQSCLILLTNSDNGELAFRPLLEKILGDDVTPWEWEGYTPSYIEQSRTQQ
ncbi:MAG TPA: serine hydrolase domain-containing protein [Methylomirabilota bacterium]|nr:serine hydrolase domain-containing protein [Methylomirabilota bacterium]